MTKREKRLYALLAILFILFVVVEQYKPEPLVWIPTFAQNDKQPYGGYVLYDRLEDFFESKQLSFETIYELGDSVNANLMILSSEFSPAKEDFEVLMGWLNRGNDVIISSSIYSENFLDTLGLALTEEFKPSTLNPDDSLAIQFNESRVFYPSSMLVTAFDLKDSSGWEVGVQAQEPVLIYKRFGEGRLILSTFPLAYTNFGLLRPNGLEFPEYSLNLMSEGKLIYNRYYHSGRMESKTPFRYLISQPPLRWALNLTLLGILVLIIIGSQRKQGVIPILDPNTNTTLRFIKTMGGLYHREGRHASAAQKLISHFIKSLQEKYYITQLFEEETYRALAGRTGLKKSEVIQTFEMIQHVRSGQPVSEQMLTELNQKIEKFNIK